MNILHVTAHLGGGVGRAISALIVEETQNHHEILCLQQPEKLQFVEACIAAGAKVYICPADNTLNIESYDIVIVHWWAHPIVIAFLADLARIPIRLVLWVHISGLYYPALPFPFLDKAQRIFFTSPYSYENKEWTSAQRQCIKQKSTVIYGSGLLDCAGYHPVYRSMSGRYCVGYAGTFARSKLHPNFVKVCAEIVKQIPNVYFLMVGDKESGAWILQEAAVLGIDTYFKFMGYMSDMGCTWGEMDVLGYPLNPQHFGTTENVILESMAAGVPVVLLDQATEKYIVEHYKTGILAKNLEEYVAWIVKLYYEQPLRFKLGTNAIAVIKDQYLHAKIVNKFQIEMQGILQDKKKIVTFKDVLGTEPASWFISMLPKELGNSFIKMAHGFLSEESEAQFLAKCPYILKEKTKGSIIHFSDLFPQDIVLKKWATKIKQVR